MIVNVGSITGAESSSYGMEYATAKAGLMYGFTKSVAQYGAKHGIRCVCVSPGPVLTRANMASMPTLLGHAAEPDELTSFVMYMCSDKARSITGSSHLVDSGRACAVPLLKN